MVETYTGKSFNDITPPLSRLSSATLSSKEGTEAKATAGFASVDFFLTSSVLFQHLEPKEKVVNTPNMDMVKTHILESVFQ